MMELFVNIFFDSALNFIIEKVMIKEIKFK